MYFLRVFILIFLFGSQICIADTPDWERINPLLDNFITSSLKTSGAPGCVVAIVGPKDVYFIKAYGVKKRGHPDKLTRNTLFQLGSVSKPITATVVIKLYGQKKLDLEIPVTSYLPAFQLKDQVKPLTLKHILSHTSGVPRYGFNPLIESHAPRSELLRMLQTVQPSGDPGSTFDYHNVMFSLLQDVIHGVSEKPFDHVLTQILFEPLQMNRACIGLACIEQNKDRASPHVKNNKGEIISSNTYSKTYYNVASSGGINASMDDLIPFVMAHLGGYPDILSASARNFMYLPQISEDLTPEARKSKSEHIDKSGYSLGWRWMDYAGKRVIYHGGWVKGFHNMIAFLPDQDIGIIILHNAETKLPWKTTCEFLNLVLDVS